MTRYSRHIILSEIGQAGQNKISNAKVLVIGAGGLGCPVLQYLCAAGIGSIGIVDFDIVEESNLQRQVLFGTSSLGKNKAVAAKERLEDLNPIIEIIAYTEMLTSKNALQLFELYDIVVDGTDNFRTRYLINDAAIITGKPVVYGAIYKFEGQVSVFNYKNGPSYRCLFSKPPEEGAIPNCSEIGVLGVLPGIIGSMQANEVLKIILGFDDVLSGKLLCYDAKTCQTQTLKLKRFENEISKVLAIKENFIKSEYSNSCDSESLEITFQELSNYDDFQLIDVRELHEPPRLNNYKCLEIPLGELIIRKNEIPGDTTNIIFCQSGMRSNVAVKLLQKHNINNCLSLKEGVLGLMQYQNQKL